MGNNTNGANMRAKKIRRGSFRLGHSGSRSTKDMAVEIVRQIFEANPELIQQAMGDWLSGRPAKFMLTIEPPEGAPEKPLALRACKSARA